MLWNSDPYFTGLSFCAAISAPKSFLIATSILLFLTAASCVLLHLYTSSDLVLSSLQTSCTSNSVAPLYLSVLVWGVVIDTWSLSRTPDFAVYVCPGGDWIKMVTRPVLDYIDNLNIFLVMEETF